jgi:hypothetical protein
VKSDDSVANIGVFRVASHEKGFIVSDVDAFLASDAVVDAVEGIRARLATSGGGPTPAFITSLRASADPAIAAHSALLLDLAQGTERAARLGKALPGWLFTDRMAEQCTHPTIAAHHALAFAGCRHVLEICTGAAIDTQALSRVAERVTTYEADPLIAAVARGNLRRAGLVNVDVRTAAWSGDTTDADGVWADPSRRTRDGRQRRGTQYEPPLESIPAAPIVGIKVGPGDTIADHGFASEYIGFGRECRERILWNHRHGGACTVTLVDAGVQWSWTTPRTPLVVPQAAWVIEPHNALIASGGVGTFLAEIGAGVFDPHIAYGALNAEPPASPWYEVYRVVKIDRGISVRRIQESIREFGWGPATIFKKRGWERDPEDLRRALDFPGATAGGVVIVMRVGDGHQTVYALTSGARRGSP